MRKIADNSAENPARSSPKESEQIVTSAMLSLNAILWLLLALSLGKIPKMFGAWKLAKLLGTKGQNYIWILGYMHFLEFTFMIFRHVMTCIFIKNHNAYMSNSIFTKGFLWRKKGTPSYITMDFYWMTNHILSFHYRGLSGLWDKCVCKMDFFGYLSLLLPWMTVIFLTDISL